MGKMSGMTRWKQREGSALCTSRLCASGWPHNWPLSRVVDPIVP